jgi:hypothetical protein
MVSEKSAGAYCSLSMVQAENSGSRPKKGGDVMGTRKIGRDAGNGQFIPVKVAQNRPKTTVIETIKTPKKK